MKKIIAMEKLYADDQIRDAGEVWEVDDDYVLGKPMKELKDDSNVDALQAEATYVPPLPQEAIFKKVKERAGSVAGGVQPGQPQPATTTRKGGKKA